MIESDDDLDPAELFAVEEEETELVRTPVPRPPCIDDEEPGPVVYKDWSPETTKVVSGPIGPSKQYPGQRFMSRAAALGYWQRRAGRIIEDLSIPGRYIYRVRRDA
jgi:hypothetical protein